MKLRVIWLNKKMKKRIKKFAHNFMDVIKRPEMVILPGQLAFFFVLAIVPTITLVTYFASLINLSTDAIYNFIVNVFSQDIANMLLDNSFNVSGFQLVLVIIMVYYIASNGTASIITTANTIYGIKNKSWLERRLKAFVMMILIIILLVFMLIVPVFGDKIISLLSASEISDKFLIVYKALQGPIAWFIIFFFIKLLYTLAPDKKIKSSSVNYGAVFTTFGWIIITEIYSFYINNYAHYNAFYGSLTNVVILMLWFYFLAVIYTIGLALNYHKEEEKIEQETVSIDKKEK